MGDADTLTRHLAANEELKLVKNCKGPSGAGVKGVGDVKGVVVKHDGGVSGGGSDGGGAIVDAVEVDEDDIGFDGAPDFAGLLGIPQAQENTPALDPASAASAASAPETPTHEGDWLEDPKI